MAKPDSSARPGDAARDTTMSSCSSELRAKNFLRLILKRLLIRWVGKRNEGKMERTKIESKVIASYSYDPGKEVLEVEWTNGKVYRYKDVTADVFGKFTAAESKGSFFLKNIVKGP